MAEQKKPKKTKKRKVPAEHPAPHVDYSLPPPTGDPPQGPGKPGPDPIPAPKPDY